MKKSLNTDKILKQRQYSLSSLDLVNKVLDVIFQQIKITFLDYKGSTLDLLKIIKDCVLVGLKNLVRKQGSAITSNKLEPYEALNI